MIIYLTKQKHLKNVSSTIKMDKNKKLRRILRDFWNESNCSVCGDDHIPHLGDEEECELCKIEKEAIKKLKRLIK